LLKGGTQIKSKRNEITAEVTGLGPKTDGRLQKLRQQLGEKELDGIFVSQPENRYYLSGFDGSSGFLLITPQDMILATDFRYLEQAKRQAPDYKLVQIANDIADWFPKLAADFQLKTLGFEAGHLTFATYRQLTDLLSKAQSKLRLVATDDLVESLRAVKEPEEIELITKAVKMADRAFEHIQDMIHIGTRENELAWELEKYLRELGSQPTPFDIIVASGLNSALPHAKPSYRALHPEEPVVIDIGARYGGYTSDLSRTIWVGTPDDTLRRVYDIVLGAQLTAMALISEGMTGSEVDNLARTVIDQAGYGNAFGHGLGHGIGLAPHEYPRLGPKSQDHLVDGMVFTIEPGIYLTGWGGVRIEDVVVMEGGKPKVISQARKVYHD
jgi:Xaa-Pro aminopeptidase